MFLLILLLVSSVASDQTWRFDNLSCEYIKTNITNKLPINYKWNDDVKDLRTGVYELVGDFVIKHTFNTDDSNELVISIYEFFFTDHCLIHIKCKEDDIYNNFILKELYTILFGFEFDYDYNHGKQFR